MTFGLRVARTMMWREVIRFVRQPARVVAAIGTPCLFWLFMAGGFAEAFRPQQLGEHGFAAFLLPGMMTMVTIFGATFASLSLIDDRNEGWLHAAIVSPAPRWALAIGRIAGGATVAWGQAAILVALAPLLGIDITPSGAAVALGALALTSIALTAIGVSFAWRIESTGGFHGVMNLILLPLWLLSGSIFPVSGAAGWMEAVTAINPLTWCTNAIRGALLGQADPIMLGGSALFAAITSAVAIVVLSGRPIRS